MERASITRVSTAELEGKFKSKKDLYDILNDHSRHFLSNQLVQLYLPHYVSCPMRFLRGVLSDEKRVSQTIHVPALPQIRGHSYCLSQVP